MKQNIAHSEPTTYPERAAQMTAEQQAAVKAEFAAKFAELRQLAATDEFTTLRAANVGREIGAQIELFTGHERLLPAEFSRLIDADTGRPELPVLRDASLEFARECLTAHKKYPAPITDYETAKVVWESLLVQMELLPKPQRGTAQASVAGDPVKDYLPSVIKFAQSSAALLKQNPIEQWPDYYVTTFLRESRPFHELYEKAAARAAKQS
jgi:hypothetical protein